MSDRMNNGKRRLVFVAHGSRNPGWTAPFKRLADDLRREVDCCSPCLAFMELSRPSLFEVAAEIADSGCACIQVLPLFLSSGNHLAYDLPEQVEEIKRRHPGLEVEVLPPIGQHPRFLDLMREIIRERLH